MVLGFFLAVLSFVASFNFFLCILGVSCAAPYRAVTKTPRRKVRPAEHGMFGVMGEGG